MYYAIFVGKYNMHKLYVYDWGHESENAEENIRDLALATEVMMTSDKAAYDKFFSLFPCAVSRISEKEAAYLVGGKNLLTDENTFTVRSRRKKLNPYLEKIKVINEWGINQVTHANRVQEVFGSRGECAS